MEATIQVTEEAILHVSHVKIGYELDDRTIVAVEDVSFKMWPNEKIMLIGPSGCGKSTLLKAIAGFIQPLEGNINVKGRKSLEPGPDRAVVFQEFDQLFPWKNVLDNVDYALRATGRSKREADSTAKYYLRMMGLDSALDRFPHQLSGGMKQRVSIARALALDPLILLMDEPFGALDALTRTRLQKELKDAMEQTQGTLLFVTHSIGEALALGDRVMVLGQPPSQMQEIVDLTDLDKENPDSVDFIETKQHLRELLGAAKKGE